MYTEDLIALLKSETDRLLAKLSFRQTLHEFGKPFSNVEYYKNILLIVTKISQMNSESISPM